MTSLRQSFCALVFAALCAAPLAAAEPASAKPAETSVDSAAAAAAGPASSAREITMINIRYEGKIMWLPNPLIVKRGEKVKLTLHNNVPQDPNVHGFAIPEFGVKVNVLRGTPSVVEFTPDKAGLFESNCHLHPAHLKAQILVLEK